MLYIELSVQYTHHVDFQADGSLSPLYAHIVPAGGDACDFCNASPAFKGYECDNFEVSGFPFLGTGLECG